MQQQQTTQTQTAAPPVERVFDKNGNTVEEVQPQPEAETAETAAPAEQTETPVAAAPAAVKFRIGDREFSSQDEAIAYAEETARGAAAQQQLIQTLQTQPQPAPAAVTPTIQTDQVPEEFFTNPSGYLKKFGQQVYDQAIQQVQRMQTSAQQSETIWREFTDRHPDLADFRGDVEQFTAQNLSAVQGIIGTKGRAAGLDYIATKLKADWTRKADMLKPKRELASGTQARTPSQRSAAVTPEPTQKKAATFGEQLNSIRKRGRRA